MTRFWCRFFAGDAATMDPRPLAYPVPIEWWCSGYRMPDCLPVICAIVDAESEAAARAAITAPGRWPEAEIDSVDAKEPGWRPGDRFPAWATPEPTPLPAQPRTASRRPGLAAVEATSMAKDFDTTNHFLVSVTGHGNVRVMNPLPLAAGVDREEALSLIAWVSVLLAITDEEIANARRAVEST